jgi:1,2-diacylglycerol 3-beta-galactosyltransferase
LPSRIDLFFFDAGGGHRAAATALKTVIESQDRSWQVRLVNLQELLEPLDILRRATGLRIQDGYNLLLRQGWTLGASHMLKLLHAAIRAVHPAQVRSLAEFWAEDPPDLAVSLIPNFNRALFEGLAKASPKTPFVTVLTDLADYPPHFWIEDQDQWVICGTEKAVQQAVKIGVRRERILLTSGMILRPEFYAPADVDRAADRKKLGLQPHLPTGLVLFGGYGSESMIRIVRHLQQTEAGVQLICICGRNQKLASELREIESRFPIHVEEFTSEIPYFMHLSDFFIGKPGPGSISEATAMNLPVIVQCNHKTLPQERFNAEWVLENDVGLVISGFSQIAGAVEQLLEPESFERYRTAAARVQNRAVFEIPDMLERILTERTAPSYSADTPNRRPDRGRELQSPPPDRPPSPVSR